MKKLLFLLVAILVLSCNKNPGNGYSLSDKIPEKAEFIIISPDFQGFQKKLQQNDFISSNEFRLKKDLKQKLQSLQFLKPASESILSLWRSKENLHFIFSTKTDSALVAMKNIKNKMVETRAEGDFSYQKYQLSGSVFYLYNDNSFAFISDSPQYLKEMIQEEKILKSTGFTKAYQASDPSKTSVIIKTQALGTEVADFFKFFDFQNTEELADWMLFDLGIDKNNIAANGIGLYSESSRLKELPSRTLESQKLIPDDFITYYGFGFDSGLLTAQDSLQENIPEILKITREISRLQIPSGTALVLNGMEAEEAKEKMAGSGEKTESFRDIDIFKTEEADLFANHLSAFLHAEPMDYYIIIKHFVIFSKKEEVLKDLIQASQNSALLSEKKYFNEFSQFLSSQSSILFLTNLSALNEAIPKKENSASNFSFNATSLAGLQFINENEYSHIHGILSTAEMNQREGSKQTLALQTDAPLAIRPYFFKNHLTDQMDIAVQDQENTLYLYSNRGNLHWKKKLDSRINGNIFQVDLFRNGYQQLAFTTAFQLEVLDRNGNTVKPFPATFKNELTQPLAVFDYDSNRKYRFVLVQNKNIYMVGPRGKGIKGFDFEKAGSEIVLPPKHIRLGTKDYILIAEKSGKLNILSRQGKIRVPVKQKIDFSENEWYGYNGNFLSTAASKNLIEIDQKGTVNLKDSGLAENTKLSANDNTIVYLSENILHINDKSLELDYGLYTPPQLFSVKGKTLISVTDTQTQRVFVFNADAELLEGFPVYGTSQTDIANADTDENLELLVQGDENEVIIYDF